MRNKLFRRILVNTEPTGIRDSGGGVHTGGSGGASAPRKALICQKFRQNFKKNGQRSFDVFINVNEIILFCY